MSMFKSRKLLALAAAAALAVAVAATDAHPSINFGADHASAMAGDCYKRFGPNYGQVGCVTFTGGSSIRAKVACFNPTHGGNQIVYGPRVYDQWHVSTGYCSSGYYPTTIWYDGT